MPPKKAAQAKSKSKASKKDEELEEEEEEEEKKTTKRTTRQSAESAAAKSQPKKGKKEESEEEEEEKPKAKRGAAKSAAAKKPAAKGKKEESEEEEESEDEKPKRSTRGSRSQSAKDTKKAEPKKKESPKKAAPKAATKAASKQAAKGKKAADEDDEESEDEPPAKKSPPKKEPAKKEAPKAKAGKKDDIDSDDEKPKKKGGRQKKDPTKDVDPDANIPIDEESIIKNDLKVLALKDKTQYDCYEEEDDVENPGTKKFFLMQILDNYKSTFPTHFFTWVRWGKTGEVGEWSLRGFFNKNRAIKIYEEKMEERKKYASLESKKDTENSQAKKDATQPTQTTADTNPSQVNQENQKNGSQSTEKKSEQKTDGNVMEEEKKKDEPAANQAMEEEKPAGEKTETKKNTLEVENEGEKGGNRSPSASKFDASKMECPVDKCCVIRDNVEVLVKDEEVFDIKYNVSDIAKNSNHFYLFQLLRNKADPSKHYIFSRYGRVGLIGEWTFKGPYTEEQAIAAYRQKQNEKKEQNKYTALEMSYTKDDPEILTKAFQESVGKSKLDKKVVEFIQLIFDFKMMNNSMAEAGYDTKKLPLGKLSLNMINKGFSKLSELSEAIKNNAGDDVLAKLSSEFYTIIPQNVGWQNMKTMTIRENKVITEKTEFLESLRQIQVAYQMVHGMDESQNPIDLNYEKLKCDISPLDRSTEEFKKIQLFIDSTKESHNIEIMEAFKINKHGADETFRKELDNHVMLWHGSRLTNFVGILSQGLRIAPPEAPVSGYRLGKGIYLADMISKSVPYCYASASNNIFCIMVCETALGNMNEKLHDDFYASNLPPGKHSTKALGRVAPPVSSYQSFSEGATIPTGKPERTAHDRSSFQHNEFIVYNVNQVNIRYLLKMKVNSRW